MFTFFIRYVCFYWAHKVVWISYWPSEPVTGVRIPIGPYILTVYIGAYDFHAFYPNETEKWKYDMSFHIEGAAAIDENGTICFGTIWAFP